MPTTIRTLHDAEAYLLNYSPAKMTGESYTLDRMVLLMERLGNPQNNLKVVHVAGTSGKTSTAYYIRSLLEATGMKTGLTASPHITSIAERVQIGGRPLGDELFLTYLNRFLAVLDAWPDIQPTYFELLIAFAYWVFNEEKVGYAVIEVGLGGTLDATNVITRNDKVCVITPIGLDHTNVLGDTIELIANQKAGIIGRNQAVFAAPQVMVADRVIKERCDGMGATVHSVTLRYEDPALPDFQRLNFSIARAVVAYLWSRDGLNKLSANQVSECAHNTPPGRFEKFFIGDKTVILDGAHNAQKLSALAVALKNGGVQNATWLVGFIEAPDQKIDDCLSVIVDVAPGGCIFTQFTVGQDIKGRKSVSAAVLLQKARSTELTCEIIDDPKTALETALHKTATTIVVTGSLYLVAHLRRNIIRRLG